MNARRRLSRIVVAADGAETTASVIEAAAILAARLHTRLAGLFVEDEVMLRMASLDLAKFYGLVGGDARTLNPAMVEALFRTQANHIMTLLDMAAKSHAISQREALTRRGQVARELIDATQDGDLLVLGWASRHVSRTASPGRTARVVAEHARQPVLLLRGTLRAPFLVPYDGTSLTADALALAVALAQDDGEIQVLLLADDPDRAGALKTQATAIAGEEQGRVRYLRLSALTGEKLCHLAALHQGGLMILPRRIAENLGPQCADALARSGCSLLWLP